MEINQQLITNQTNKPNIHANKPNTNNYAKIINPKEQNMQPNKTMS